MNHLHSCLFPKGGDEVPASRAAQTTLDFIIRKDEGMIVPPCLQTKTDLSPVLTSQVPHLPQLGGCVHHFYWMQFRKGFIVRWGIRQRWLQQCRREVPCGGKYSRQSFTDTYQPLKAFFSTKLLLNKTRSQNFVSAKDWALLNVSSWNRIKGSYSWGILNAKAFAHLCSSVT